MIKFKAESFNKNKINMKIRTIKATRRGIDNKLSVLWLNVASEIAFTRIHSARTNCYFEVAKSSI